MGQLCQDGTTSELDCWIIGKKVEVPLGFSPILCRMSLVPALVLSLSLLSTPAAWSWENLSPVSKDESRMEIDLIGGASVKGVIVKETGTEIFVDIGPTIVTLPKNSIRDRRSVASKDNAEAEAPEGQVYQLGSGKPLPLEEAETLARGSVVRVLAGGGCLLYTSPSPRDKRQSRMPSSA